MVIAVVAVTVAVRITISSLSVLHLTSLLRVGLKSSRAGGRGGGWSGLRSLSIKEQGQPRRHLTCFLSIICCQAAQSQSERERRKQTKILLSLHPHGRVFSTIYHRYH